MGKFTYIDYEGLKDLLLQETRLRSGTITYEGVSEKYKHLVFPEIFSKDPSYADLRVDLVAINNLLAVSERSAGALGILAQSGFGWAINQIDTIRQVGVAGVYEDLEDDEPSVDDNSESNLAAIRLPKSMRGMLYQSAVLFLWSRLVKFAKMVACHVRHDRGRGEQEDCRHPKVEQEEKAGDSRIARINSGPVRIYSGIPPREQRKIRKIPRVEERHRSPDSGSS